MVYGVVMYRITTNHYVIALTRAMDDDRYNKLKAAMDATKRTFFISNGWEINSFYDRKGKWKCLDISITHPYQDWFLHFHYIKKLI